MNQHEGFEGMERGGGERGAFKEIRNQNHRQQRWQNGQEGSANYSCKTQPKNRQGDTTARATKQDNKKESTPTTTTGGEGPHSAD